MAACKPAALCTLVMSTGKLCRGVALRNQPFCWAHSRNHRVHERERKVIDMMDRLGDKIAAMNTSDLLQFLHQKLGHLQKSLRRYPDVGYTLTATLDRLAEITQLESDAKRQMQQNQELLAEIRKYQMNSITYQQNLSNHQVSPNRIS